MTSQFKNALLGIHQSVVAGKVKLPAAVSWRFLIFSGSLVVVYMSHSMNVESMMRRVAKLEIELKEITYENISTESELMNMSKQSAILQRTKEDGLQLHELTEPPRILKSK